MPHSHSSSSRRTESLAPGSGSSNGADDSEGHKRQKTAEQSPVSSPSTIVISKTISGNKSSTDNNTACSSGKGPRRFLNVQFGTARTNIDLRIKDQVRNEYSYCQRISQVQQRIQAAFPSQIPDWGAIQLFDASNEQQFLDPRQIPDSYFQSPHQDGLLVQIK